jgi:hypothetical protein
MPGRAGKIVRYIENLLARIPWTDPGTPLRLSYLDVVDLSLFSRYYKLWILMEHPDLFPKPVKTLVDASVDWNLLFEHEFTILIDHLALSSYDDPKLAYTIPDFDNHFQESKRAMKPEGYPNTGPGADLLPIRNAVFEMMDGTLILRVFLGN